jgi:hypothetical protein
VHTNITTADVSDCTYSRIISRRYPDGVDGSQANASCSGTSDSSVALSPLFEMAVEVAPQHRDYDNTLQLTIDQVEVVMSPTGI